jgi:pimeloyl-ACP methyl ester carboxylesterase
MGGKIIRSLICLVPACILLMTLGCFSGTDPFEKPGPYGVYSTTISVPNPEDAAKPIQGKIFAPSTDAGNSIAEGDFELVIFMPGFGATYSLYCMYTSHLASHGSIVIGMNFIPPTGFDGMHDYLARQATYVIDYALGCGSPLERHLDCPKIATAGHSLGGKIAFYAAAIDPRITVVMAMDPSNSGGPPCFISPEWCNAYPVAPNVVTGNIGMLDNVNAASFIMRAAPDPLFNPDPQNNAFYFFYGLDGQGLHGVKRPALYFDVGSAGHISWLTNANVIRIAKRTMVAWLKAYFHGESLDQYFTGSIVQKDVTAGYIVAVDTR